jgi:hypothetical protein
LVDEFGSQREGLSMMPPEIISTRPLRAHPVEVN